MAVMDHRSRGPEVYLFFSVCRRLPALSPPVVISLEAKHIWRGRLRAEQSTKLISTT
jgi:hypothetical protein